VAAGRPEHAPGIVLRSPTARLNPRGNGYDRTSCSHSTSP
jgi:hypothetical protein